MYFSVKLHSPRIISGWTIYGKMKDETVNNPVWLLSVLVHIITHYLKTVNITREKTFKMRTY